MQTQPRPAERSSTLCTAELFCVPPSHVKNFWPHVRTLIRDAMARGGGNLIDAEKEVFSGRDQLWLAWDGKIILAAAITSLGIINEEKICTIVACGGNDWPRFGHLIKGLEKFAKDEDCKATRINGRPGWQRLLDGYELQSVVLRKELS